MGLGEISVAWLVIIKEKAVHHVLPAQPYSFSDVQSSAWPENPGLGPALGAPALDDPLDFTLYM